MGIFLHTLFIAAISLYVLSSLFYARVLWVSIFSGKKSKLEGAKLPFNMLMAAFAFHLIAYSVGAFGMLFFGKFYASGFLQPTFASTLSLISFFLVGVFVVLSQRLSIRFMGAIVAPLAFLFFLASSILFHYPQPDFFPKSTFLWVHIALSIFGHVAFLFAFIFSLFLLIQEKLIRSKISLSWQPVLPAVRILDDLNHYSLMLGFIFMITGVFTAVIYAGFYQIPLEASEKRMFWSLLTLAIYSFLLVGRNLFSIRGSKSAWMSIVAFLFVACSLVVSGMAGSHVH